MHDFGMVLNHWFSDVCFKNRLENENIFSNTHSNVITIDFKGLKFVRIWIKRKTG